MRLRRVSPFAVFVVACCMPHAGPGGLLEGSGPDAATVLVHVVAPIALAVAMATALPHKPWPLAAAALVGVLALAEAVRLVVIDELVRTLRDSKGQFLLLLSLAMQASAGAVALVVTRFAQKHVAARRRRTLRS